MRAVRGLCVSDLLQAVTESRFGLSPRKELQGLQRGLRWLPDPKEVISSVRNKIQYRCSSTYNGVMSQEAFTNGKCIKLHLLNIVAWPSPPYTC